MVHGALVISNVEAEVEKKGISQKQKSMTERGPLSEWILNSEQLYNFASNCTSHDSLLLGPFIFKFHPPLFTFLCPTCSYLPVLAAHYIHQNLSRSLLRASFHAYSYHHV